MPPDRPPPRSPSAEGPSPGAPIVEQPPSLPRAPTLLRTLATALLALPAGLAAQGGPWLPENPGETWTYVAPPLEPHCLQTYRLFLPSAPHVMPPDGWPVLISLNLLAYTVSNDTFVLTDATLLGRALEAGIAVVVARATPSQPTGHPDWLAWCGAAPTLPGHGLFHPPGYVPPDLAVEGLAPYDDPRYAMPEKDAVMLVQHVRHLARGVPPFEDVQHALMARLDHRRLAVHGVSAGASSVLWTAVAHDRRHELPFAGLGGQYAEATRPQLVAVRTAPMWRPIFRADLEFDINHFGAHGHSEDDARLFGDADPVELLALSPLAFEDEAFTTHLPVHLVYGEASVCTDYIPGLGPDCDPYPFCYDAWGLEGVNMPGGQPTNLHPAWSGYAWKAAHPDTTRLVVFTPEAAAQAGGLEFVAEFGGNAALDADTVQWLQQQFAGLLPSQAAAAAEVLPAGKILGTLPEDGVHSLAFDAVAGSLLGARASRLPGQLHPGLRVIAPDGGWLAPPEASLPEGAGLGGKTARLKHVLLPSTGSYRLEVLGTTAEGGAYRARFGLTPPKLPSEQLVIESPDDISLHEFDAVAGSRLTSLRVSRSQPPPGAPAELGGLPAALLPRVVALRGPDGVPMSLEDVTSASASGKRVSVGPIDLPLTGTYTLELGGADASVGYGRLRVRLRAPRAEGPLQVPADP